MTITGQSEQRKNVRRQGNRRHNDTDIMTIGEKKGKDQTTFIAHEAAPQKKTSSVWSWHEEFAIEWSETFITKKRK